MSASVHNFFFFSILHGNGGVCSMYGLSRRIWQKLITSTKAFEARTTRCLTEAFYQIGAVMARCKKQTEQTIKQRTETDGSLPNLQVCLVWVSVSKCTGWGAEFESDDDTAWNSLLLRCNIDPSLWRQGYNHSSVQHFHRKITFLTKIWKSITFCLFKVQNEYN